MSVESPGTGTAPQGADERDLPLAPQVRERSGFSVIWLIPLVAALIGAWIAYQTWSEQGPTVRIFFKTAEGLEAGKTKVRFRSVVVGEVTDIGVDEGLDRVVVSAGLVKGVAPYLTDKTRFWVVRARIAGGQVSGLGTLLSGAYIGVDPNDKGRRAREFEGLAEAPLVSRDEAGRHFVLRGKSLGSVQVGSPVHFRGFKVGDVIARQLEADGEMAQLRVFVSAPYDAKVRVGSKFWNDSGIDLTLTAQGLRMDTDSVTSILIGGVGFETPQDAVSGRRAEEGHVFRLYSNKHASEQEEFRRVKPYRLYFTDPVGGLAPGSRVDFRGMQLGTVKEVSLEFDMEKVEFRTPVLVEIEESRVAVVGETHDSRQEVVATMVEKGLRAQLRSGNLLTGSKRIELDMFPDAPPARLRVEDGIPVMPTVPAPLTGIVASVTEVLEKLERLPLDEIGEQLRDTLEGANRIANAEEIPEILRAARAGLEQVARLSRTLNRETEPLVKQLHELLGTTEAALRQSRSTLRTVSNSIGEGSPLYGDLAGMLRELNQAARSIRVLADYLERHPEALVSGKAGR